MVPLVLDRRPSALRNAARRLVSWGQALLVVLMIAPLTGTGLTQAQISAVNGLAPIPLEPIDNSYVAPPAVTFRWTPADGNWGYNLEIQREDQTNKLEIHVPGSSTDFTYTGLEPGYTYIWSVEESNGPIGQKSPAVFTLSASPIAPMILGGVSASDGTFQHEIEIGWGSAYRASYYLLQRRAPGSVEFIDLATVGEARIYTDTEPLAEQRYEYRVLACNIAGCSAPSPVDVGWVGTCNSIPAPRLLEPADGSEIHYTRQDAYYFLKWQQESGLHEYWLRMWIRDTSYFVLDEYIETSSGEPGEVNYIVSDVSGDLAWNVIAVNPTKGCPNSPPSETWHILAVVNPPPAVPVSLKASNGTYPDRVVLTWEQPVSESVLESWQIWRAAQPDLQTAEEIIAIFADNDSSQSYEDQDTTPGTLYYYWIEACSHSDGCSSKSEPASGFAGEALPEFENSIFLPVVTW